MGHNNLANLLRDGSDDASLRAAGRAYAEAIRLAPRYLEAYKNLGNLLKERASWRDAAIRAYRVAIALLPAGEEPGASLAPRSYALYESLGEDATTMVTGSAYFSVLSPGARLKAHCGPTNVRLRIHVGLLVAEGAGLRVGNETRAWAEDEVLIFDDSFEHAVWNDSNDTRLVFIVDVWHPQLRTDEERTRALDGVGKRRYERATAGLRYGRGLPEEADLVAERRVRTIY